MLGFNLTSKKRFRYHFVQKIQSGQKIQIFSSKIMSKLSLFEKIGNHTLFPDTQPNEYPKIQLDFFNSYWDLK